MPTCVNHPGRTSARTIDGQAYCQACADSHAAAGRRVDRHVDPKPCFVQYTGRDGFAPIPGTGCAHWVAHECGIRRGSAGEKCHAGFTFRVRTLISGKSEVRRRADVRVGDWYVKPDRSHVGIVRRVTPNRSDPDRPTILIRHCSSALGRVADSDFDGYFDGAGSFLR